MHQFHLEYLGLLKLPLILVLRWNLFFLHFLVLQLFQVDLALLGTLALQLVLQLHHYLGFLVILVFHVVLVVLVVQLLLVALSNLVLLGVLVLLALHVHLHVLEVLVDLGLLDLQLLLWVHLVHRILDLHFGLGYLCLP